jgi:phosphate transport system substrate-binding protein
MIISSQFSARSLARAVVLAPLAALLACAPGDKGAGDSSAPSGVALNGAGATFPYPIYSKWFSTYAAKTGVKINYQSIGSGGGVRQISEGTIDFGATDAPMSADEMSKATGGAIMHIPTVIGMVTIAYNVPEITVPLKLTGETVADIFLGKIKKWDDPRIAATNPGVTLPSRDILVVHRAEGSGTTFVFTDYLSAVSPEWASGPGRGKDVQWPVGLGARGNEAVSAQVKQTPYAIGYIELAYAKQTGLPVAHIRNPAGQFVEPTPATATAAAEAAMASFGDTTDYRVSIVNASGANAYPISSFTWLLVYRQQANATKGKQLTDFVRWALTEGESQAAELHYAPLPQTLVNKLLTRLDSIAPKT